ncbi:MAG TPA: isochorismate synthase [Acidimicrobiia bacterium]|nr:isochorismate synthase [Acidimicrobiia bacterium]
MTTLAASLPRLAAVTRAIDTLPDLLDARGDDGFAWLRDGTGIVTAGVAARVAVEDAEAALAAIETDDPLGWPGTGPLAVGALPFDSAARGELVIPSTVVGRRADGRCWVTEVGDRPARLHVSASAAEPSRWTVSAETTREKWRDMVDAVLDAIDRGEVSKVVLARQVVVEADAAPSVTRVLTQLRAQQTGCFLYHADGLIGATPELLVRRDGTRVASCPLAGTAPAGDDAAARLRASAKDAWEHRLVVDDVVATLGPVCETLAVPAEASLTTLASVVHLATPVDGTLREPAPSALALARALHPTPAVAGTPRDPATRLLTQLEPVPRGRYAGPVGWVDARGDGEWAVALRGAQLDGCRAVLHAGAGIVRGSEPDAEWAETQAKLEPMLGALIRP